MQVRQHTSTCVAQSLRWLMDMLLGSSQSIPVAMSNALAWTAGA